MPLQECSVNVNRELKELRPHGTLDFPCAGYSALYADDEGDIITWHWHEEMEIVYVMEGCMEPYFREMKKINKLNKGNFQKIYDVNKTEKSYDFSVFYLHYLTLIDPRNYFTIT